MKGFFKYVFAGLLGSLLAMVLIGIITVFIIVGAISSGDDDTEIKEKTVLLIKLNEAVEDRSSAKPSLNTFSFEKTMGMHAITQALKDAETDERIKGVFLDLNMVSAGMATAKEIRDALKDFKKTDKFIIAHADYYTHKSYYLASVADKVYMTPEGELQFLGLSAQIMMYKNMLQKVGIEPEIIRHGKFKSAVEPFMLDEISEANRLQTRKYLSELWMTMLKEISESRSLSVEKMNLYADSLMVSGAKAAKDLKFVDDLKYFDEVNEELKKLTETNEGKELATVCLKDYVSAEKQEKEEKEFTKDRIAVIYATGTIEPGKGDGSTIGSETLSEAIRKARKDEDVKAIVLRINSPGGSALASEVIWRETVLAKKEKPFIVSMGDVAASGGYYIACFADTIVAQPNTITGSIGVFGLLFNATELMDKIGLDVSNVNTNAYSDLANPSRKMTQFERNVIQNSVVDVYDTFISHVSEGREMEKAEVDSIGQGRVWSGADAKEIGLVDVMGGLADAIEIAKEKAELENYRIKEYPEKDKMSKILEDLATETKADIIESELGEAHIYYKRVKELSKIQGIQARMPYFISIN